MKEKPESLLEETSELLDRLMPIMQRSIDALQHDPNPLLQHLTDQEIERQESLLQQVEEMKERIRNHLDPPEPIPEQDEPEDHIRLEILRKGDRSGNSAWRVTMPNGELIQCCYIKDTFDEVIRQIGVERVESLGIEYRDTIVIRSSNGKRDLLEEICRGLGITLKILDHR